MTPALTAPAVPAPPSALRGDVLKAVRVAASLGASLLGTWAVGLAVRIALPRHLGPAAFGGFQFADAFTAALLVVAGLGLDTYTRKEVTARPAHATEFFGGTFVLRLLLGALVLAAATAALRAAGRGGEVLRLVALLGVAQGLANVNLVLGAMLQAVGEVDGLAAWNVGAKLAWGAGIAAALAAGWGVTGVALAMLGAEALKGVGLAALARRHVGLRFRIDVPASAAALRASLPYLVGGVAQMVYGKVDVAVLSFLATDTEVGWYGAATTLGGMTMLLAPVIGWVLLPLTTRAAARSRAELLLVTRRAMEAVLCVAVPASLAFYAAAEPLVRLAFGPAYLPAAPMLRVLAPTVVLTYAAMVSASVLVRLERGWAVSWVTLASLAVSPALSAWLVPRAARALGPGGAGVGAAASLMATELFAAGALAWLVGRGGVDRRLARVVGRTLLVCAAVVAADALLAGAHPAWRLAADAALYAGGVVAVGALDPRELLGLARGLLVARRGGPAPSPTPAEA